MKRKIKVICDGKTTEGEIEIRNTLHFEVQKITRAHVFENKRKYNRKKLDKIELSD